MTRTDKKRKLVKQILKFGVVGGIAFLIDFIVYSTVLNLIDWEYGYLLAGVAGFTVSLIFNYLASMAFVFVRREGADKRKEFIIFLILSLFGLGINTVVLWICIDIAYNNWLWLQALMESFNGFLHGIGFTFVESARELAAYFAKVIATGIVMVYNFISRKLTLEKKDDEGEENGSEMQNAETT
ncbi:MAG: GtrA family protein [Lachnospiraceae bacterium]